MKHSIVAVLCLFATLHASATTPSTEPDPYLAHLQVTIVDPNNGELPGAWVVVTMLPPITTPAHSFLRTAASRGTALFWNIPPGRYIVVGGLPGFLPDRLEVSIPRGYSRAQLRLTLQSTGIPFGSSPAVERPVFPPFPSSTTLPTPSSHQPARQ